MPTPKSSKTNAFHYPALRKMEQLEKTLVQVPPGILRLNELLKLRDDQCIYCQCDVPYWNNKNVEGDEVYPCTLPQKSGNPTHNGRMNTMNKYTCCKECNSSKGQKIDDKFESWVEVGGNKKGRKIPLHFRQRIIDWYKMSKYWITTDEPRVIREMIHLQEAVKTRPKSLPKSRPRTPSPNRLCEKTFVSNRELISLFTSSPHKTNKDLGDYLGISSSNISQWRNYETFTKKVEVPPKHLPKIREFFNM